jgi:hypothetical protein
VANQNKMSEFTNLVDFLVAKGLSIEKAVAVAREEKERERACELFYCHFILVLFHNLFFRQFGAGESKIGTDDTFEKWLERFFLTLIVFLLIAVNYVLVFLYRWQSIPD